MLSFSVLFLVLLVSVDPFAYPWQDIINAISEYNRRFKAIFPINFIDRDKLMEYEAPVFELLEEVFG
jgi:hypothetical protein